MTRRRELLIHRAQLLEIRNIMNSMKNLAYFETRKLTRYIGSQQQMVLQIETTASDLLHYYPELRPKTDQGQCILLLLGSERGFCGDFNAAIHHSAEQELAAEDINNPLLISVGNKLQQRLEHDPRVINSLPGANAAEEVGPVLSRVIDTLAEQQRQYPDLHLKVLYHEPLNKQVVVKTILPPFADLPSPSVIYSSPPLINLAPAELLHQLIEQYLFAALYSIGYASLMTENQSRIEHLENAVRRLDEKTAELSRKGNAMRQEEIIEEIEVILLNATPTIRR